MKQRMQCSLKWHNWVYAGRVESQAQNILPKMIRGKWEPIVTTEEFERGLAILEKRNERLLRKGIVTPNGFRGLDQQGNNQFGTAFTFFLSA
jgi:hypothetical protein